MKIILLLGTFSRPYIYVSKINISYSEIKKIDYTIVLVLGCDARIKNVDGQLPRAVAIKHGKKPCVRELRKCERASGKVIRNANPKLIQLYDWSVTRANEINARFAELAEYLASENERIRASQVDEVIANAEMNSADQTPLTAVGDQADRDTTRTNGSTIASDQTGVTGGSMKTRGKGKRKSRRGKRSVRMDGSGSGLEPIKRMSKDDIETVFQTLQAPYDSQDMWSELMKLHEKNGDASVDWAEFMTGKKYVNKAYLISAFEGKKKRKTKGKKGKQICTCLLIRLA